jgi:hypothetical protein
VLAPWRLASVFWKKPGHHPEAGGDWGGANGRDRDREGVVNNPIPSSPPDGASTTRFASPCSKSSSPAAGTVRPVPGRAGARPPAHWLHDRQGGGPILGEAPPP